MVAPMIRLRPIVEVMQIHAEDDARGAALLVRAAARVEDPDVLARVERVRAALEQAGTEIVGLLLLLDERLRPLEVTE